MTSIKFDRSGGILGQDIDIALDLESLPAGESLKLLQLVQKADFFRLPKDLVGKSTPDEFLYTVTVESGNSRHQVRTSDTSMPDSLLPLINELCTIAMVSYQSG